VWNSLQDRHPHGVHRMSAVESQQIYPRRQLR
jgi:hypothetical protein